MFIGHFAVAFAAKRVAPELSLGTLFLAAQLADLVWPTLVLLGVESFEVRPGITAVTPLDFLHYPYSHMPEGRRRSARSELTKSSPHEATPGCFRGSTRQGTRFIPNHDSLRIGTLAAILANVGAHHGFSREALVEKLFGR
jgi:hypothetical protein